MCGVFQEQKDWQWKQAMDYLSAVSELNYMTQIVIMLYEDNDKVSRALGGRHRRRPVRLFMSVCASPAGADVRGAFPRGTPLQPGSQRLRGRGECSSGLRLPSSLLRGASHFLSAAVSSDEPTV